MFKRKDLIIYISILLLAGAVWALWTGLHHESGSAVQVSVDGVSVGSYPLSDDLTTDIAGYKDGHLTLVISGGEADVIYSSCPDLICVHHSPISHTGESIICMPNRIEIEVIPDSTDPEPEIDGVS